MSLLLIAGGALDPHNRRLHEAAQRRGVASHCLWVGPEHFPRLHLQLPEAALILDGEVIRPDALWLRHDIFHWLADPRAPVERRAQAWYEALLAYAMLHPALRLYNRGALLRRSNKLLVLQRAAALGLRIPDTQLSNDAPRLRSLDPQGHIAKPLIGGAHTALLGEALDQAPQVEGALMAPALVQEALIGPELRVQLVGPRTFAWEIDSPLIDHRLDPQAPMREVPAPGPELLAPLRALAQELGLDLCAADFKRCPRSGAWVFLEINTQPMWVAFDTASKGALAEAILDGLLALEEPG